MILLLGQWNPKKTSELTIHTVIQKWFFLDFLFHSILESAVKEVDAIDAVVLAQV